MREIDFLTVRISVVIICVELIFIYGLYVVCLLQNLLPFDMLYPFYTNAKFQLKDGFNVLEKSFFFIMLRKQVSFLSGESEF